jgi:large subunit ribosomal protein L31e
MPHKKQKSQRKQKKEKAIKNDEPVTRDYTINLRKRLHKVTFKRRAPTAIKEIRKFAQKHMATNDVRVAVGLNQYLWSKGIKSVPGKVRVRMQRKRNDDEDTEEKMYTLVSYVPVSEFKGFTTELVDEETSQ